jgi:uncharacterized protein (UPF0216 family)
MEKITLKLYEFYNLEAELNGVTNQQNGEVTSKGLLAEKIKMTTKYWLNDLVKKVVTEKEACETLKQELIKKHGEADEQGNVSIPMYINIVTDEEGQTISREINPKFVEFQSEFNAVLNEDKELEYKGFTLEEFENVESEGKYDTFFKLIKVGE